ncbi:MAG TPA: APC family permease [Thermoanaerobaculia bacterium]|nr:APC family permease [Thermoanaerobaculia bacterium]
MSVPAQPGTHKLLTVLGVTFGLAVVVGNSIGAGIVRTPGTIAGHLPDFWPFIAVWVAGGLYALLGTNAMAELATMIPRSGGQYVFVRRGLGEYPGFVVGWSDWLSTCGSMAAMAILLGESMVGLFPELRTQQVVALAAIAGLTVIQWLGVRWGGAAQTVTSALKVLVLLAFVAVCFALGSRNPLFSIVTADREGWLLLPFILSLQAVIYTFDGWAAPVYFSEEIRRPGRSLPRAMFGGVLTVIVIYLLLNIAFAVVVPLPTLAGKNLAAGAVAQHLFGYHGDTVIRAVMVIALISAVNSTLMMAPRVLFAMGSDRLFWRGARQVNAGGTPDVALLVSTIVAAVFIASGTFEQVIAKLAFFFVASYALSFLSLFVLRRREPAAPRPYRAWGHPWTTGLALAGSVVFLLAAIGADPRNSLWAAGLLALSYPVYRVVRGGEN